MIAFWGDRWRQRLRLAPLAVAAAGRGVIRKLPARLRTARWRPGLSVVIPERDAPVLLAKCLDSLHTAMKNVLEPVEVIVSASGAALEQWNSVRSCWPSVRWVHQEAASGFVGSVRRGLASVRYDWVYLLNNDALLEPDALVEVLAARRENAFALASSILVDDPVSALEETGLTGLALTESELLIFDIPHDATDRQPRQHFYCGGGASLFRTALLRRYVAAAADYEPGYFEDVEWGLRAWQAGWSNWFVPTSRVRHQRSASFNRFFSSEERHRLRHRNELLLALRHPVPGVSVSQLMHKVCASGVRTQKELARPSLAARVCAQRLRASPWPEALVAQGAHALRRLERDPIKRRTILLVVPFCMHPATHGGARRTLELTRILSQTHDVVVLGDEAELWAKDIGTLRHLRALWLVWGRAAPVDATWRARRSQHAHARLCAALKEMQSRFDPEWVIVEHAQLLGLIAHRRTGERWVADLHDVEFNAVGSADDDAEGRALLTRFDIAVCASAEDRSLIAHDRVLLIPNGAAVDPGRWQPSRSEDLLLFVAAMRHPPNCEGLVWFVDSVWPKLRAARPGVRLAVVSAEPLPIAAPGIERWLPQSDLDALYAQATLTINPQRAIRGSALKCIESICAGRICVATVAAARGLGLQRGGALRICDDAAGMVEEILRLLSDELERHTLERPGPQALAQYRWERCAEPLHDLLSS